jgi:hypothetical protein
VRKRKGAKPFDLSSFKENLESGEMWAGLGRVYKPPGQSAHYEIADGDVYVDVLLTPDEQPLHARLGGALGGPGYGIWRVPPVDTEVALLFSEGAIDSDALIVAVLASQQAPAGLDGDTLIITNPKNLKIQSTGGDVNIEADGKVNLQGGGAGVALKGMKVDLGIFKVVSGAGFWTPPIAIPPSETPPTEQPLATPLPLYGYIADGSDKTESG